MIINLGDAPFKAFITVTYPRGTLTVTGEGQSFSHSGGGTVTFTVKKKGTYTAEAVYGAADGAATITISKRNQTASATLTLQYLIFNGGSTADYTGGWSSHLSVGSNLTSTLNNDSTTYPSYRAVTSNSTINISDFSSIQITVNSVSGAYVRFIYGTTRYDSWGSVNEPTSYQGYIALSAGTKTLDTKSVSGSKYLGFTLKANTSSSASVSVKKIVGIIS